MLLLLLRMELQKMPNDLNVAAPISLLGAPRSGTTLLSSVFRLHPDTNSKIVGETGNLIFGMWHALDFARGVTLPLRRNETLVSEDQRAGEVIRQAMVSMFPDEDSVWFHKPIGLPKAVSEKFDDSQWDEAARWYWRVWTTTFPEGKNIAILRNPCDVIASQRKVMKFDEDSLWWSFAFVMYLITHESAPKITVVRYERLVEEKEASVRELFAAVDLSFDPRVLEAFDEVYVAAPDRSNKDSEVGSRSNEWADLDASKLSQHHRQVIEDAFASMGEELSWPSHFEELPDPEAVADDPPEKIIATQQESIERLHRQIESMNMDFAAERRHLREEKIRWENFVKRHRHVLPVRLDLAAALDQELEIIRPQVAEKRELDESYVKHIEEELHRVTESRAWVTAEKFYSARNRSMGLARKVYGRAPYPARRALRGVRAGITERRNGAHETAPAEPEPTEQPTTPTNPGIAFVLPSGITLGGVTSWAIEMGRITSEGHPVSLIRHLDEGTPIDLELPGSARVIECNARAIARPTSIPGYAFDYRESLPAVLVPSYNYAPYAISAELSKKNSNDLRVVGFAHTDHLHYYALLEFYEPIIHRFIAVSDEIGAKLRALLPARTEDIEVRPYGVHVADQLDRTHSPAGAPLRLVYAGRIEQDQKRVMRLLLLAEALAQADIDFTLDIVGSGPDSDALADRHARLAQGVKDRVRLLPPVAPTKMTDLWRSHDICVLVSAYEGTSIAMLEAMANGCVPVVTEVSGTDAVIENGVNGFYCPRDRMRPMVEVIQRLSEDRELLGRVAENGHATIVEQYNYARYAESFTTLCADLWQQEPRSWPADSPALPADRVAHEDFVNRRLAAVTTPE